MCRPKLSHYAAVVLAAVVAFAATRAGAQNPPTCNASLGGTDIAKNPQGNIVNGTVVHYTITIHNPASLGADIGCNVLVGPSGVTFNCPAADGTPTGPSTLLLAAGTVIPAGSPDLVFNVDCTVNLNPGLTSAQAAVFAPGSTIDSGFPNDFANLDKAISINVVTPCISVTKNCVNLCTPYGAPIQFSGTVSNCGNITLTNVTVTDDHAGLVLGPITLVAHESADYSGQYTPPGSGVELCGPFTDTVTAIGGANTQPTPTTVTATASATCHVLTSPSITLVKDCYQTGSPGDKTLNPGETYVESFTVCNTGDVALTGVTVTDDKLGTINFPDLPPLSAAPANCVTIVTDPITPPAGFCGPITDHATAHGNQICPPDATCPSAPTVNSTEQQCTVTVICQPRVCVTKQVVCANGTACDDPSLVYGSSASGLSGSVFCYKIVVSNCGTQEGLVNVHVHDDQGVIADQTIPTLAVGASATFYGSKTVGSPTDTTPTTLVNIVTVDGTGADSGLQTCVNGVPTTDSPTSVCQATATVDVKPISIRCSLAIVTSGGLDLDDNPNDGNLTIDPASLPTTISGACSGGPGGVVVTVENTGQATLLVNVNEIGSVAGITIGPCCLVAADGTTTPYADFALAPGASTNISCDLTLDATVCPGPQTVTANVTGTATAELNPGVCLAGGPGTAINVTTTSCSGTIRCLTPVTCRTTGGGTLYNCDTNQDCTLITTVLYPLVSPNGLVLDHVSHGGQLGAPFSRENCNQLLSDPCIRGEWEHNRHYQGKGHPRDTFASTFHSAGTNAAAKPLFDTLLCACLGCCTADGTPKPGVIGDFHPNGKFRFCNPDDHKICGPEPRPAPANALIFSGIGNVSHVTDTGNTKPATWVVYRVYIEDRSEPGGFHPKGSVDPADIYVFQAWDTGIAVTKKPDAGSLIGATSPLLGDLNLFRSTLSADSCAFLRGISETGDCPAGSLPVPCILGVSATVVDEGALRDGNRQIHPSTSATCNNPGGGVPAPTPGAINSPACANPAFDCTDITTGLPGSRNFCPAR